MNGLANIFVLACAIISVNNNHIHDPTQEIVKALGIRLSKYNSFVEYGRFKKDEENNKLNYENNPN